MSKADGICSRAALLSDSEPQPPEIDFHVAIASADRERLSWEVAAMVRQLPHRIRGQVASDHAIRRRIVLLDAHAESRFITALVIREFGHVCVEAESIPAATAAMDTCRADTIVYEWRLPQGCTRGLSIEFRRHVVREDVGSMIIVLSTQDEPPGFRDREDVDAYLTKPFDPRALRLLLAHAA